MASQGTRTQKHPMGLLPGTLSEIERVVASDEAPALAPNAALEWIGKPVPRADGRRKVTGEAAFTVDEPRHPVTQVCGESIQPFCGTWPFLLIDRTGRIVTTHTHDSMKRVCP